MMASHRPADAPAPLPPEPVAEAPVPAASAKTTLPPSPFLVGFDWVLAVCVLTLAFLIASFSIRNSDFWMHLSAGRLLANGQYEFGKDPFSYVGADRIWVNHAWLFDWVQYQLYKAGGGAGVVVAKAILVALTAGLLLLARKPGQSVFPGVICVALVLVAAAPRLMMQPIIVSFVCLAALMFLLIRVSKRPGSWQFPILVGVVFCIWANCDQWFFLGPVLLLLYVAGQYLRPDDGEDIGTLWKALGIGVLACMLNPHHVRVWTLPPELFDQQFRDLVRDDIELGRLIRGGLTKEAWDFSANAANPTAMIVLLVLCGIGIALNYRRLSVGLFLVWLGAAILAAFHMRALPFLAFVTAPVAAVNLAALGRRIAETPMSEGTVRTLHAVRSGGRSAVCIAIMIMVALTYAGWLHPFAEQRRWKWDVEPSLSLARAAERIQQWREDKILPPEARLLNLQPDFASYVAWYAPGEKTYFDYRIGFHAADVPEYVALRRYLSIRDPQERRRDPYDLAGFLRKHRITYAVSAHPQRPYNFFALQALWGFEIDPVAGPDWVLWGLEGRAVILGWTKQEAIPTAAFARLRFDPLRAAYAEADPLRIPDIRRPLPPRDVWERYVMPPPYPPPEGEETLVLLAYQDTQTFRAIQRHRAAFGAMYLLAPRLMSPAFSWWTAIHVQAQMQGRDLIPVAKPPEVNAVAHLAVRAARKAIITSPDHSDGYYFLAKAYMDPVFDSWPEQNMVKTASLARCRARLPDDPTQARTTIVVLDLCDQLSELHSNSRRLDLLYDITKFSVAYLKDEIERSERNLERLSGDARDRAEKELDGQRRRLTETEKQLKQAETELARTTDRYITQSASKSSLVDRAMLARQFGLYKEATDILRKEHERFQKQLQAEGERVNLSAQDLALQLAIHAELIELLMFDGQVEEASQILDAVDTADTAALMTAQPLRDEYKNIRHNALEPATHYRRLRQSVAFCLGDFETAVRMQVKEAENLHREMENFRALNFPKAPPSTNMPGPLELNLDMWLRPVFAPHSPVAAFAGVMGLVQHVQKASLFLQLVQFYVDAQVRLGLTHLEWGDIPKAAHYFREALAVKEFPTPIQSQRQAQEYLKAIERARGAGR